ncbi:MAG TPA: hypothetical protein VJL38_01310 [Patescibacteria group bacterium]|nr:hypothetical protein [Patescibacteria group bacterium]
MRKKNKKFLFGILAAAEVFMLTMTVALPAQALSLFSTPSASSMFKEFEQRYGFNQGELQKFGESANVADYKRVAPEMSVTFSPTNPRPGEQVKALAVPVNFSNDTSALYFTWYLKHAGDNKDLNDDGEVNIEDYKIEAHRIIAQNGFSKDKADYGSDGDEDGYKAIVGGDNKTGANNFCYIHDFQSGTDYELAEDGNETSFECPDGTEPRCVIDDSLVCPATIEITDDAGGGGGGGDTFTEYTVCRDLGRTPSCDPETGTPSCGSGVALCADTLTEYSCADTSDGFDASCNTLGLEEPACTVISKGEVTSYCTAEIHLFPHAPGHTTGDGSFNADEEEFWGTSPQDPGTANNNNKDEANIVGLGIDEFSWNYQPGDQVGVVIEGTSQAPTKHDDSSFQVMWAFAKNDCAPENTGAYVESVKGTNVTTPTTAMDRETLNACLEKNFLEPNEGGQPGNLEVGLTATPTNPRNGTADNPGDVVTVQSFISNSAVDASRLSYEWTVERSADGTANPENWIDVTKDLVDISQTKGIGLPLLQLRLTLPESYFSNDSGYIRVRVTTSENFSEGQTQDGSASVIIGVNADTRSIITYATNASSDGTLSLGEETCTEKTETSTCPVMQGGIVGLSIPDTSGLNGFSWTMNGVPLTCDSSISPTACGSNAQQGNTVFFPVTGLSGEQATISLIANDVTSGKEIAISRTFAVMPPSVRIVSPDGSAVAKKLGEYVALDGATTTDYSSAVMQASDGDAVTLEAQFTPSSLSDGIQMEWVVDGVSQGSKKAVTIPASTAGTTHSVSLAARYMQPPETRQALSENFGVSQYSSFSSGSVLSASVQIEVGGEGGAAFTQPQTFFASIITNTPSYILFLLRIILTGALILFIVGFLFNITPSPAKEYS